MIIRIFIVSFLLIWNTGCLFTGKEIAYGLGAFAYISKEILDYKHEKREVKLKERGLDLKKREIELKEEIFEEAKAR
ncbi:MAG TPA: hypothetical protein ENH85_02375 [Candidatus Scalindua sp.]|nr:hypothetical protein [Candidatus Scalindua sp.]